MLEIEQIRNLKDSLNSGRTITSEIEPTINISNETIWIKESTKEIFQYNGNTWNLVYFADTSNLIEKISPATEDNIASLNSDGSLKDSGISTSDINTSISNTHTHLNKTDLDNVSGTNTGDEVQATELIEGIAKISTEAIAKDETTTNDTDIITPLKSWNVLTRFKELDNEWDGSNTFNDFLSFTYTGGTGNRNLILNNLNQVVIGEADSNKSFALFKGNININTDFPLIANVQIGWWYSVKASVTDNAGILYTNTNTSWLNGQEIYWDGETWQDYGQFIADAKSTVGIGGQYAKIYYAILDGKKNLILVSPVTETLDTIFTTSTYIDCNKYNLTINCNWTLNNSVELVLNNSNIFYGNNNVIKNVNGNSSKLILNGNNIITHLGTAGYKFNANSNVSIYFDNLTFNCANFIDSGLGYGILLIGNFLIINGAGTNCNVNDMYGDESIINSLKFTGTFSTVKTYIDVEIGATCGKIYSYCLNLSLVLYTVQNNIRLEGSNGMLSNNNITIEGSAGRHCEFNNLIIFGNIVLNNTTSSYINLLNCQCKTLIYGTNLLSLSACNLIVEEDITITKQSYIINSKLTKNVNINSNNVKIQTSDLCLNNSGEVVTFNSGTQKILLINNNVYGNIVINGSNHIINDNFIGSINGGTKTIILNSGVQKCNIISNIVELNTEITNNSGQLNNNIIGTQIF